MVLGKDLRRDEIGRNAKILCFCKRGVQIKVLDFDGHEAGPKSGDSAFKNGFDGGERSGGCTGVAVIR